MTSGNTQATTIDDYLANVPPDAREKLQEIRQIVKEEAPEADEAISYRMPAFKLHGILVYFGAFKDHVGLYPTSSPMDAFREELAGYKTSKGAIQFPLDRPLPVPLIRRIVQYRVKENLERTEQKRKK